MPVNWLTIDQIADYLQVSKEKVYRSAYGAFHTRRRSSADSLASVQALPAGQSARRRVVAVNEGGWRFDVKEVDAWLKKQRPKKEQK